MDGRRKRSRGRTARHAGVVLKKRVLPSGAIAWRARFKDPDTKRETYETLPPERSHTEEQRTGWAIEKAHLLHKRAEQLSEGAPGKKHATLEDAVAKYFENARPSLRPQTLNCYTRSSKALLEWARVRGHTDADELRGEHLADLRAWIANKKLRRPARGKGSGRRARVETAKLRSPSSVNRELRETKVILEALRKLGLVPMLSRDAISDNLKLAAAPRPVVEFMKPAELVKLIEAAKRHDADAFDLTREEKERGEEGGTTPKHAPVLPYLVTLLLTGMRADEARLLRWESVDLAAPPAGVILLRPEEVKTKHGRQVDLVVSEVLRELLASLKLRAGSSPYVFGGKEPLTYDYLKAARKRLVKEYGAPAFSWQKLRVTCGTFLANAPGIFGAASAYREARQLGHSVTVAERFYLGVVHVPADAKTLEEAMGLRQALRVERKTSRASG